MGSQNTKPWDPFVEELFNKLTNAKQRAELEIKRVHNDLHSQFHHVRLSKGISNVLIAVTISHENQIKALRCLIKNIDSLLAIKDLNDEKTRDEAIVCLSTIFYFSNKIDMVELIRARSIIFQVFGKKHCKKIMQKGLYVDNELLDAINAKYPTDKEIEDQYRRILREFPSSVVMLDDNGNRIEEKKGSSKVENNGDQNVTKTEPQKKGDV